MSSSGTLSNLLGYTSIACWLGAQLPQLLENLRRQSCEGLALPFLANWFLGDFSNLIGCILTNQLPFQRYLATYFCCIDFVLLLQYIYYQKVVKSTTLPPAPTSYSQRATSTSRRLSIDRSTTRYRTLSAVAANVAAAAALAAHQDRESARHTVRRDSDPLFRTNGLRNFPPHVPLTHEDHDTTFIDSDDDAPAAVVDSFYSEGGRDIGRKRVAWSIERHGMRAGSVGRLSTIPPSFASPTDDQVGTNRRTRSLERSIDSLLQASEGVFPSESMSPSFTAANRRNSRAGKKSATMVFLGTWALFGVGTFMGSQRTSPGSTLNVGRVLSPMNARESLVHDASTATMIPLSTSEPSNAPRGIREIPLTFEDQDPPPTEPAPPPHDSQRILGRIFAWLCTTLYLTSRLPQIWKNFVRKSVEGLSMYLFVFAFLGNVFYVASILLSPNAYLPPPESTAFLKESIPYLLGSGGTLMFDVTIVTQSFLYKPKHKRRHARSRSNTATNIEVGDADVIESERTGLLAGDALAEHHIDHRDIYSHHQPTQQQQHSPVHSAAVLTNVTDDGDVTRGRTSHAASSASR